MAAPSRNPLRVIYNYCETKGWVDVTSFAEPLILVTGGLANAALFWSFLRDRKSLSASQVLGVNLVVMNLLYLSTLPLSMIFDSVIPVNENETQAEFFEQNHNTTGSELDPRDIFKMFNLIGCPLLLTCMCFERCLAVIRPVLYLRLRKWEYRMAVSALIWLITLSFCLAEGFIPHSTSMMLTVIFTISILFFLMLACLGGVIWSLQQQSPAHETNGCQSTVKRQAVFNVLVVVVSAVVAYLPVLGIMLLVLVIYYCKIILSKSICTYLEIFEFFPMLGVFICPLFYLSKAKQAFCLRGGRMLKE